MKKQTKIIILHTSYSSYYRDKNNTNVVPMLYPAKRKSLYITYIQAFEDIKGDPGRTRTPITRTGIWNSIRLNYGTMS